MDKIEFEKIHNVVTLFLKEERSRELKILGSWYYRFLKSNQEKLSLHLPYYSKEFSKIAFNYIRTFTIIFNLLKDERLSIFEGTCLFDIFNYLSNEKLEKFTLDFEGQKENFALWENDTLTKLDTFLPVFNRQEILEFGNPKSIKNTFKLFKIIRNSGVVEFPQLIELEEKILSFNNLEHINNEFISENLFLLNTRLNRKEAIQIKKELNSNFENCISVIYPYSLKPTFPLTEIGRKKINLRFNNRFAYNDILDNDLFLLNDETNLTSKLKYSVIDTNHSKDLYELFKYFKEQWAQLELNKFTTPFPKYWLLFLNASLTKEEWLEQFKIDFPAVAEKPIIKTIEKIIDEVIELNWIEKVITDSTKILFPELKSSRKKRLEFVFNNFKNFINSINSNVQFINSMDLDNLENIVVLDSFNIIDLVNKNQIFSDKKINVVVPDFLYFGYRPGIKVALFNYQFTPMLNGMREALDDNYSTNKDALEEIKTEIINVIKSDLKNYRRKYKEEIEEEIEGENPDLEDLEFENVEEIEVFNSEIEHVVNKVVINKNLKNELTIPSTERVLLQKDSLFYVKAGTLNVGDFIIRNSDISELYKSNYFYDKLVNIPQDVLLYQYQLFQKNDIYKILKNNGISYQHRNYFDNNYAIEINEDHTFRIPRRKKDWAIICEYLNINNSDQQLSFIAYYGRSKQNDLKKMYKSIIELLLENNWIGTIEDPVISNSVSEIVYQYNSIFNATDATEISEISDSIISTIFNQLRFTEIKTIENE